MSTHSQLSLAKKASRQLVLLPTKKKNQILKDIALALKKSTAEILSENKKDLDSSSKPAAFLDRLKLTPERIQMLAQSVLTVIKLADPVGVILEQRQLKNKINLKRVRVPFGVIGAIFEARPNVVVDIAVLAFKSGNATVLKGSQEAKYSNQALVAVIRKVLKKYKLEEVIQLLPATHQAAEELLKARGMVDVVIPRGGKTLIDFVVKNAQVPVIETGASVVHLFIDEFADLKKAVAIAVNSKVSRPSVCNALDVLLVHTKIVGKFIPLLVEGLLQSAQKKGHSIVELRASLGSSNELLKNYPAFKKVSAVDFDTEFLDYILVIKVVKSLDEALEHIYQHSLKHTESIVTNNKKNALRFTTEVDAANIFVNASTRFSDGGVYGLGAEVGISTQKLHARGPFALEALTTYKWIGEGDGQVRE